MESTKSWKHSLLFLCLMMIFCFLFSGCGREVKSETVETKENLPVVRVGLELYAPFVYLDVSGNYVGIDIDIAKEAFHRVGYKPEFVLINWEDKDKLLSDGEIDCIWCCYSMSGRRYWYRWAGPYMKSRQVVAVNPYVDIQHLSDLKDKVVAVRSTTKAEELLNIAEENGLAVGNVYSFYDRNLMFTSLYKGYVDAIAGHEEALRQYMKDNQLDFRILPEPLEVTGIGAAFSRTDSRKMIADLDVAMKDMANDGTTEAILKKYLDNPSDFLRGVRSHD